MFCNHTWKNVKPNEDDTYTCLDVKCDIVFPSKYSMTEHYKIVHMYPELSYCSICKRNFSRGYIKNHMKRVHKTDYHRNYTTKIVPVN